MGCGLDKCTGKVITEVAPKSYTVQISQGMLRQNRCQLILSPSTANDDLGMIPDIPTSDTSAVEPRSITEQSAQPPLPSEPSADGTVRTRSGRTSRPTQHYRPHNS